MDVPSFAFYEDIKTELLAQEDSWALYDKFEQETTDLGQEFWAAFAKEVGRLQDHLNAWAERLKGRPRDLVTQYLRG